MEIDFDRLKQLAGKKSLEDKKRYFVQDLEKTLEDVEASASYSEELCSDLVNLSVSLWEVIIKLGMEEKVRARINMKIEELLK